MEVFHENFDVIQHYKTSSVIEKQCLEYSNKELKQRFLKFQLVAFFRLNWY